MEPLRLVIENFMGHRFTDIDCSLFESALIVGKSKNDDRFSNGAGKSTIFKAIEYVLFGEYEAKTIDKIVRNGCDKARVTFDFILSDRTYRIQRTRNRKSGKSDLRMWELKGAVWADVSQKTPTEIENELAKMIKISYPAFRNSILFAQSDLEGLASTKTPAKRKEILKEALNLLDYTKFEKIAKEDAAEVVKKITAHKSLISLLGTPKEDISDLNDKLIETKKLILAKEKERENSQSTLTNLRTKLSEYQRIVSGEAFSVQEKLGEVRVAKKQLQNDINISKKKLEEKDNDLNGLIKQLNQKVQLLSQMKDEYDALKLKPFRTDDVIKKELESVSNNESNGKSYIISIENRIVELQQPMPDGDQCPHCRQPLSPEHKLECSKKIAEELQEKKTILSQSKRALEGVKNKRLTLEIELREIASHGVVLNNLENKIEIKKAEIQHNQSYIKQVKDLVDHIRAEHAAHVKKMEDLLKKEEDLKESARKLSIDQVMEKITQVKDDIERLEARTNSLLEAISSSNTHVGILTERLSNRNKDAVKLDSFIAELKDMEKELQIKQLVIQGFSSGGIPTMIIYTILDDLQIEANKILGELRPGLELQFSVIKNKSDGGQEDTLDINYRLHGMDLDYELLSGGQKLMIALSLRLGLSIVIQHRLGVDIKFLELDEVDEKLDKAGVDAFAAVIKKLQDRFKIFVITHNDMLKSKFSHAILVDYDQHNGSSARLVDTW